MFKHNYGNVIVRLTEPRLISLQAKYEYLSERLLSLELLRNAQHWRIVTKSEASDRRGCVTDFPSTMLHEREKKMNFRLGKEKFSFASVQH